jgi:NAD(P)-dependent dehydrogenase (short-subunit alcohol dehydrogenase family)
MATVLLTGAGGGFGKLTALALRERGHEVYGTLRDLGGRNAAAARELKAAGVKVIEMDVTDDVSVDRAVAAAVKASGGIDAVINNAGLGVLGAQEAFTAEDMRRLFDINVFGAHRVTRALTPSMRQRGNGLVLFVTSLLGRITVPFYGPYNASKWAMEAMAENYSMELSSFGVDVAVVEPGGYPTPFLSNVVLPSDEVRANELSGLQDQARGFRDGFEKALAANPSQDPKDVADAIVALVEAAPGTRPFRTTVDKMGMGVHVSPYNDHLAKVTSGIFGAFGLTPMLERRAEGVAAA